MGNLKNNPSLKINTLQNTLLDSMKHVVKSAGEPEIRRELGDKFFIFIMHRQENLFDPKFMDQMLDLVIAKSKELNCLFILHKPTKVALEKFQLMGKVTAAAGVVTAPRLSYVSFTKLLSGCEFIVTDGGSNQEESYYFGKPCCVLRSETERTEGLNHNVLLSKMDFQAIKNFLDNPYSWQKDALQLLESPSSIIAKSIRNLCTTT
jgi:UDP-N-acetylglucosamine 2-epimerase (non-hydrolysing)